MSDVGPEGNVSLPLAVARRVNALCEHFEDAWRAGRPLRIEEFLRDTPEAEHRALFRELLVLELAYRRRKGEKPTLQEYCQRFPEHAELIAFLLGAQDLAGPEQWAEEDSPQQAVETGSNLATADRSPPLTRLGTSCS
jgi:hypothetical protein